MSEATSQTVTIDGKEYDVQSLSEEARTQIVNLRVTDQEIQRLKQCLAITQTARVSYAKALEAALPKVEN